MDKKEALKRLSSLENEAQQLRKILEEPKCIMECVETLSDAVDILGLEDVEVKDLNKLIKANASDRLIAHQEMVVICKALNEGVVMDVLGINQKKYFPCFKVKNGKLVFADWSYYYSYAYIPSLLCVKSSELATYAGTNFISIYKRFMLC